MFGWPLAGAGMNSEAEHPGIGVCIAVKRYVNVKPLFAAHNGAGNLRLDTIQISTT